MKQNTFTILLFLQLVFINVAMTGIPHSSINRKEVVDRHKIITTATNPFSGKIPSAQKVISQSTHEWESFWKSGATIDLSESKDERWKELERRIILSQYLMRVNEAGSLPPQESGLINNGWYGRLHFEMIWWHGVHYALWNRWSLFDKSLHIYQDYLPTSTARATSQGYKGARWPKCTGNSDREWPHVIHATLIW